MYDIVNLHSQYALFTFFYPLFFSCYVHCTAVYTVYCPVHSCSLTVVLPERTIYSHFVYFLSKVRSYFGLHVYWFWGKISPCTFIGIGMNDRRIERLNLGAPKYPYIKLEWSLCSSWNWNTSFGRKGWKSTFYNLFVTSKNTNLKNCIKAFKTPF